MGVVVNQSIKNTIITYIGFGIGAVNILFLFTNFVSDTYFGLITFIFSTANILMPLMAFGAHNTIIKFYTSFKTRQSQNNFLCLMLLLPLLLIIPGILITYFSFDFLSNWLSSQNSIVKSYTWYIFISAVAFAYFEIFYAWSRVQMQSVFGNFMKEVFHRITTTILLILLYFGLLTAEELVLCMVAVYVLRMLIMSAYAFSLRFPIFKSFKIYNGIKIIKYAALIIVAGSVANMILEIDKFMIGKYVTIENVAYYGVAIYIATVIGVPARAMQQITYPLTAKFLNNKNNKELSLLYRKSSLNLFIIGGFIFLLIILNINQLYKLLPTDYSEGLIVVFVIGISKLFDTILGNNNAILFYSDYYRVVLLMGVFLVIVTVLLNVYFIPNYGINGASYATALAIFLYNIIKLGFVHFKMKMQPFTVATGKTFCLIIACVLAFYFWDFSFHSLLNIAVKSLLLAICYGFIVYRFNLSEDVTSLINKLIKR